MTLTRWGHLGPMKPISWKKFSFTRPSQKPCTFKCCFEIIKSWRKNIQNLLFPFNFSVVVLFSLSYNEFNNLQIAILKGISRALRPRCFKIESGPAVICDSSQEITLALWCSLADWSPTALLYLITCRGHWDERWSV